MSSSLPNLQRKFPDEVTRDYEILRQLGAGGMGTVYLARERSLGRLEAVKILRIGMDDASGAGLARFRREAQTLASFHHRNILTIYRLILPQYGEPAIAMEYVQGPTLQRLLRHEVSLSPLRLRQVFIPLCDALDFAHRQGIIHRDLKPSNVLIKSADGVAKLFDFGIARVTSEAPRTQTGLVVGTPAYMSPEQCDSKPLDHRSDIYSLGVMLYEAMAGRVPFDAPSGSEWRIMQAHVVTDPPTLDPTEVGVPEALVNLVMHCLRKSPEDRPGSAAEVRDALEELLPAPPRAGVFPPIPEECISAASEETLVKRTSGGTPLLSSQDGKTQSSNWNALAGADPEAPGSADGGGQPVIRGIRGGTPPGGLPGQVRKGAPSPAQPPIGPSPARATPPASSSRSISDLQTVVQPQPPASAEGGRRRPSNPLAAPGSRAIPAAPPSSIRVPVQPPSAAPASRPPGGVANPEEELDTLDPSEFQPLDPQRIQQEIERQRSTPQPSRPARTAPGLESTAFPLPAPSSIPAPKRRASAGIVAAVLALILVAAAAVYYLRFRPAAEVRPQPRSDMARTEATPAGPSSVPSAASGGAPPIGRAQSADSAPASAATGAPGQDQGESRPATGAAPQDTDLPAPGQSVGANPPSLAQAGPDSTPAPLVAALNPAQVSALFRSHRVYNSDYTRSILSNWVFHQVKKDGEAGDLHTLLFAGVRRQPGALQVLVQLPPAARVTEPQAWTSLLATLKSPAAATLAPPFHGAPRPLVVMAGMAGALGAPELGEAGSTPDPDAPTLLLVSDQNSSQSLTAPLDARTANDHDTSTVLFAVRWREIPATPAAAATATPPDDAFSRVLLCVAPAPLSSSLAARSEEVENYESWYRFRVDTRDHELVENLSALGDHAIVKPGSDTVEFALGRPSPDESGGDAAPTTAVARNEGAISPAGGAPVPAPEAAAPGANGSTAPQLIADGERDRPSSGAESAPAIGSVTDPAVVSRLDSSPAATAPPSPTDAPTALPTRSVPMHDRFVVYASPTGKKDVSIVHIPPGVEIGMTRAEADLLRNWADAVASKGKTLASCRIDSVMADTGAGGRKSRITADPRSLSDALCVAGQVFLDRGDELPLRDASAIVVFEPGAFEDLLRRRVFPGAASDVLRVNGAWIRQDNRWIWSKTRCTTVTATALDLLDKACN